MTAHRRMTRLLLPAVVALVVGVLFVRWATDMPQSGVRLMRHSELHSVAQAAALYEQDFKTSPTLDDLLGAGLLHRPSLSKYSIAKAAPGQGAPDAWLIQTVPCRPVKKGDAWGGPGDKIDHDLPACRYVLKRDWTVVQVDEPDYQRDLALRVRLVPIP